MARKRVYYNLDRISELESGGMSARAIAKKFDIDPAMLNKWLKQHTTRKVIYTHKRFHGPKKDSDSIIRSDTPPSTTP